MKYRDGRLYVVSLLAVVGIVLLVISLVTEHWLYGELSRTSNSENFYAGNKTFGLFRGCEYKRFGKVVNFRTRCFNAFSELSPRGYNGIAYATAACICISCFCLLLVAYLGVYSELVKSLDKKYVLKIPYILSIIAAVVDLAGIICYSYLYEVKLKDNVINEQELKYGFLSSTELRYSFWLYVGSWPVLLSNVVYFHLLWKSPDCVMKRHTETNETVRSSANESQFERSDATRKSMVY